MKGIIGENSVTLCGICGGQPQISHEYAGRRFLTFPLMVSRLSGNVDILNVQIREGLMEPEPSEGEGLRIRGQLRSYNNRSGTGARLILSVYALSAERAEPEPFNEVILLGAICREPVFRRTPLGREICDLMLAVPRANGRADYLPCVAWGQTARRASELKTGNTVRLRGRFQSRQYIKERDGKLEERTAFEVSVIELMD
ncbi:MAG: single-stranded DNA-binding protein [Oscillospiraceae bacterium]|jgi:single-strand DNA-binding protein